MGIVQRQSLKNSLVNYLGIIIGGMSTMFIYPLDWELYGNIQFSLSTAALFSTFFSLGSHALVNKYFPYFKNNNIKGFLNLVLTYSLINIALASLFLYIFHTPFYDFLEFGGFNKEQITENLFIIYPLGVLAVFIGVLRSQSYNHERIVYPDLITNFSVKIAVPTIVLLSYFAIINYQGVGWLLVLYHIIVIIWLILYLKRLNGLDIKWGVMKRVKKNKHIEMIRYMLYGAMNHVGDILVYKIDIVMIGLLLTPTQIGYYSIFLFLTVVIEIPTNAVIRITKVLIAKAFEDDKLEDIERIYKSASANLFSIGIVLLALIWMNMNTFFYIMTNGENLIIYKSVFLFLALAKLFDMVTSVNFHIISYSPYFRVNTAFILILAFANIVLNYYFIQEFGIIGAAISTAISMLLFNILKTVFIAIKYEMHPFKWQYSIMALFLSVAVAMPLLLPNLFESPILSIMISGLFTILFVFSIYKLKVSIEINSFIDKYWAKIFK